MKEKILFIAGGPWQKPFVKYLKDKGHFVAVVNPVATDTTNLADLHIECDINDLDLISRHIARINPSIITSDQSDVSTTTVAKLCERFGLPCNSVEVIEKFTNKVAIHDFGKSLGIRVPESRLVHNSGEIEEFAEEIGYPIIIKPTDSTNSRGFRKIDSTLNRPHLHRLFANALAFSKSKQVVAQEYVDGLMVVLDGVCSGGRHRTISSARKDEYFKPGINTGIIYPSRIADDMLTKIIAANDLYAEQAGMIFGLTHSEYIIKGDEFWLIEIGGRGGGAGITDKIVPWVSGVNVYDVLYESLLGYEYPIESLRPVKRSAMLKYYDESELTQYTADKQAVIDQIPGVADFRYNFIGKQYVSDDYDNRHSFGIFLANTDDELKEVIQRTSLVLSEG